MAGIHSSILHEDESSLINYLENCNSVSDECKDFLFQCLRKDSPKQINAFKLAHHPFVLKYKDESTQITWNFFTNRLSKVTEFRKNALYLSKHNLQHKLNPKHSFENENIADESEVSNTIDIAQKVKHDGNTIEYTLDSESRPTFFDKASFNLTEFPSNIELTSRSPNFYNLDAVPQISDSISHIKPSSFNNSYEEVINVTPKHQPFHLTDSLLRAEPTVERRKVQVPVLKLNNHIQLDLSKANFNGKNSSFKENTLNNRYGREEIGIIPKQTLPTVQRVVPKKLYKATNESNFVVKHKISATTMKTNLNCSNDTEITLNPITVDRSKFRDDGANSTQQIVEEFKNVPAKDLEIFSFKELSEQIQNTKLPSGPNSGDFWFSSDSNAEQSDRKSCFEGSEREP